MNMQSDSKEKRAALDHNGIELNLVYYYASSVISVERGDIPYFTVNRESNILDVIEAFKLMTSGLVNKDNEYSASVEHLDVRPRCSEWRDIFNIYAKKRKSTYFTRYYLSFFCWRSLLLCIYWQML